MATLAVRGLAGPLVRASHPQPCVAVAAFGTALAASAGNDVATCALVAGSVFTGQLTIGWSNDRLDASADRTVGRVEKPIASGALPLAVVDGAVAIALVATVVLSSLLGWRAGLLHLAAVACGWGYNVALKRTWWSWLPYALAFGALPGVATLALPTHPAPAGWVVGAAAMLGVAAHLVNVLPDLDGDRVVGVRGLPNRLGAQASLGLALLLLVAATVTVMLGPPGPPSWSGWAGTALTVLVVALAAPSMVRRSRTRTPFYAVIALVPIDMVMILLGGAHLQ